MSESLYFTVPQVAELLDIDQRAVQRYIRIGKLHGVKVGRTYRIPKDSIENLLPGITSTTSTKHEAPDLYDAEGLISALEDLTDDELDRIASILSYVPDALPKAIHQLRLMKNAYKALSKE